METVRRALRDGVRACAPLKSTVTHTLAEHDCASDWMILSHGPQTADPLDPGSGEIAEGEPIIVDLFPRDRESACYADMTRTFCIGAPSPRLRELHDACNATREALVGQIRAGANTQKLARLGCDLLRTRGYHTFLDPPGAADGVLHMFSHGVGLEIIEPPEIWLSHDTLVAGDVISLEPALYFPDWGGCRVEDLLLVIDAGAENLTRFPYDLELL
jgi:Xaa-Pro aminopeptidase